MRFFNLHHSVAVITALVSFLTATGLSIYALSLEPDEELKPAAQVERALMERYGVAMESIKATPSSH